MFSIHFCLLGIDITWTSNVKYFFKFLMIMTRKGNLMPKVFFGSAGQEMKVVLTLVPTISNTRDWMSLSVIRLMWPLRTFLSHICKGLLPILYKIDKNPLWNVFLNIFLNFLLTRRKIHKTVSYTRIWFLPVSNACFVNKLLVTLFSARAVASNIGAKIQNGHRIAQWPAHCPLVCHLPKKVKLWAKRKLEKCTPKVEDLWEIVIIKADIFPLPNTFLISSSRVILIPIIWVQLIVITPLRPWN